MRGLEEGSTALGNEERWVDGMRGFEEGSTALGNEER
jgi:hypothetical protein